MKIKRKSLFIAGFCLFLILFSNSIRAETMYVTDVLRLALRSGKSSDQSILGVIMSGQIVEVLQIDDQWAQVRLPDGKEGWVQNRYLTPQITKGILLESLEQKHKVLKDQLAMVLDENSQLTKETKSIRIELNQMEASLTEINSAYEKLKTEAADYLNLKSKYEGTSAQLAQQAQQLQKLKEEIDRLETRQMIRWFLTGSGVLLFGIIIGFAAKRKRRRFTV